MKLFGDTKIYIVKIFPLQSNYLMISRLHYIASKMQK